MDVYTDMVCAIKVYIRHKHKCHPPPFPKDIL